MTKYNDNISYEIVSNGYKIYLDGKLWITQLDEYSKPMDARKTYEENCLLQLEDITRVSDEVSADEALRAIEEVYND